MATEKWYINQTPAHDKKPQFQVLNSTGTAITLSTLAGYGVVIYDEQGTVLASAGTGITGLTTTLLVAVNSTTFSIALSGSLVANKNGKIYARTVIATTDASYSDSQLNDWSELTEIYNCEL